ncbi:CDK5 regulatory subunit-associated protein 3 isoform X2 [Oratosquilla oratoria]|uniref:CDK5 regulatory subunit-associated protein 3 isoform X2 n=1 Tax=Oratosquilla oratoria TaxID=337810 RepID=UPI003F76C535
MEEQSLPIDIHTGKLVDWLISRRHTNRDWPEAVRIVREKINNAIQDMPEHPEITKLLSGTYINYFHCLRIVEILKETEKDSKNILGWYGSQRMKDWQEVIRLYEKDSMYLAEAAQMLVRNVQYELPAIKRTIAKCDTIQQDCERKEKDCLKNAANAKDKYLQTCKQIGITGDRVKQELLELLKELPGELTNIAGKCKDLKEARQLYRDFLSFTLAGEHFECLPLLSFVMERGNVTTYEWTYGEPPIRVEEPKVEINVEDDDEGIQSDEIDFGDLDGGAGAIDFGELDPSADIDFGDELTTGEIDWGNLATEEAQGINWGVGEEGETSTVDIIVEDSGVAGGVAKDAEALSVLGNPKTRNQFIDELLELEGFLTQRNYELQSEGSVLSLNQFSGAPETVQYHAVESTTKMLSCVQNIVASLTSTKMQHLYLISMSSRYVDRLTESLRTKRSVGEKMIASQAVIQQKSKTAQEEQAVLGPKLQLIGERTRELQKQIEEEISKKYKNRPVNLMGVVNAL